MPGWRDEYLASLREQERNNPVNLELVDLCASTYLSLKTISNDFLPASSHTDFSPL